MDFGRNFSDLGTGGSNYLGQYLENGSGDVTRMLRKLTGFFASHGM